MCPFPDILKSFVRANLISFFTFCLSSILSEIHKNLYCTYNALYISLLFNFQGSSSPFWATACSLYYHPFFLSREILRFLNIFSAKPKTFDYRAKMEIFGVTKMSFCPCFSGFFYPYAHARKDKKEEGRGRKPLFLLPKWFDSDLIDWLNFTPYRLLACFLPGPLLCRSLLCRCQDNRTDVSVAHIVRRQDTVPRLNIVIGHKVFGAFT